VSDLAGPPEGLLRAGWFPFILNFYWRVVPLFERFRGLALTSWFRTPESNRIAGGSTESQHLFALAMDLNAPGQVLADLAIAASRQGLVSIQERDHVHVQLFPAGALARAGVSFPS